MASTADRYHGPKKRKEREEAEAAELVRMASDMDDLTAGLEAKAYRLRGSASLDYAQIMAASSATLTLTVAGATTADDVTLHHTAAPPTQLTFVAWCSAPDVVTVRAYNRSAVPVDPAPVAVRVSVWKV